MTTSPTSSPTPSAPSPSAPESTQRVDILLTPAEVATLFKVDPKTVTRWAKLGKLSSIRTLGGHRRYKQAEVLGLLNQAGN